MSRSFEEILKELLELRTLRETTTFTMANADRHDEERAYLRGLLDDMGRSHVLIQALRLFETPTYYQLCSWVRSTKDEEDTEIEHMFDTIRAKFVESKIPAMDNNISITIYYTSEKYPCEPIDPNNPNSEKHPSKQGGCSTFYKTSVLEIRPNSASFKEISGSVTDF